MSRRLYDVTRARLKDNQPLQAALDISLGLDRIEVFATTRVYEWKADSVAADVYASNKSVSDMNKGWSYATGSRFDGLPGETKKLSSARFERVYCWTEGLSRLLQ